MFSASIPNSGACNAIFHDDAVPPERVAFCADKRPAILHLSECVVFPQLQHFLRKTGIGFRPRQQPGQTSAEITNPTGNDLGDPAIIQTLKDFFQDLLTPSSPDHPPEIWLLH